MSLEMMVTTWASVVPDLAAGLWAPVLAQAEPNVAELAKKIDMAEVLDLSKLLTAAIIVVGGLALTRLLTATLDRLGQAQAKRRLMYKKIASIVRLTLFILAAYLVVFTFFDTEENQAALIGLSGTLAFAIGFALKDALSSLAAGVLILIDQPFQVGDRIQFGDTYGEVTEIGLRSVRIATLDDNAVSIPNNKFLTDVVASANSGALDMMVVIDFHIAMTEDFERAKRIVYEACITSKYVFLSKPVRVHVREHVTAIAFSTRLVLKAYVIDCRYEVAFLTDVTERVKRAFREQGINYPYVREYSVRSTHWEEEPRGAGAWMPPADRNAPGRRDE